MKADVPIVDLFKCLDRRDGESNSVVFPPFFRRPLCWRIVGGCYKRRLPKWIRRKGLVVALGGEGAHVLDVRKQFSLMLTELPVSDHGDEDKGGNQAIFAEEGSHGSHHC